MQLIQHGANSHFVIRNFVFVYFLFFSYMGKCGEPLYVFFIIYKMTKKHKTKYSATTAEVQNLHL